jgi:hypothetical protein
MPRDLTSVAVERALEREGCALCRLSGEHERRWLWLVLWEQVTDPEIRDRIAAAWGFCRRHAWGLAHLERAEFGGSLGTAIIYEDLTSRLLERCPASACAPGGRRFPRAARAFDFGALRPGRSCPACAAQREEAASKIAWLARCAAEDWFVAVYRQSDGLCLGHLALVLRRATPPVRGFLLEAQLAALRAASATTLAPARLALLGRDEAPPPLADGHGRPPSRPRGHGPPNGDDPGAECPACATERREEPLRLAALLEPAASPASEPGWLCATHLGRLHATARASGREAALVAWASERAAAACLELEALACGARGRRGPRLPDWTGRRASGPAPAVYPCAVCADVAAAGQVRAQAIARAAGSDLERRALAADLCLRHLGAAWSAVPSAAVTAVESRLRARLQSLAHELREYVRKSDWNRRHEARGAEQTAWRRGVALFVGDDAAWPDARERWA